MFHVYMKNQFKLGVTKLIKQAQNRTISLSSAAAAPTSVLRPTVLSVESSYRSNNFSPLLSPILLPTSAAKQISNVEFVRYITVKRKLSPESPPNKIGLPEKFNMEWPKITLFGDSITRRSTDPENGCWGSFINYKVGSYFDVDERGFEGYNSKWALELTPKLFPKSYLDKVEVFILFFGHNDSWEPATPLHVPVDQYEANMRAIIKYLIDNGLERRKILLITPTWYHEESFAVALKAVGLPPVHKKLDNAKLYSRAVSRIAESENIDVLDFFGFSTKYEPLEELFCDGVHYSRKGAQELAERLMPFIEKKIKASFKRPLGELNHAAPWDQIPEVRSSIEAHMKKLHVGDKK